MGFRDVTGVLSRFFVIGFFLPALFGLVALDQITAGALMPDGYREQPGTRLLICGGVAVLGGLVLSGLHRGLLNVLSGDALWPFRLRWWASSRYAHRLASRPLMSPDLKLNPSDFAPTAFGRERHARSARILRRWGLDSEVAWPRIRLMLNAEQQALYVDARTELAFLVNALFVSILTGGGAALWLYTNGTALQLVAVTVGTVALGVFFYALAISAVGELGDGFEQAAIDLHRYELYRQLGFATPSSPEEERETARKVNRLLDSTHVDSRDIDELAPPADDDSLFDAENWGEPPGAR